MAPEVLRALNVAHFERLLSSACEPDQRRMIEQLLAEERAKPVSAYPPESAKPLASGFGPSSAPPSDT